MVVYLFITVVALWLFGLIPYLVKRQERLQDEEDQDEEDRIRKGEG